jgi:hypothetical protein
MWERKGEHNGEEEQNGSSLIQYRLQLFHKKQPEYFYCA